MKIRCGVLILAVLAASGIARGSVIVTGAVSYTDFVDGSGVCSSSSASASSLSLYCGDSTGGSTLTANVGDTSGNAQIEESTAELQRQPTSSSASFDVSIDGTYMLTGGTGYGYATWTMDDNMDGGSFGPCTVSVGGVTEYCTIDLGASPFPFVWTASGSFLVPYNTPFDLSMDVAFSGASYGYGGMSGTFDYNLGDGDLVAVATEPSTFLLLGSALLFLLPAKFHRSLTKAPRP